MKLNPITLQKTGGVAAWVNACLSAAALIVAFVLIGPEAMGDNARLAQMALENPTPLILQDVLKFASAAAASILIVVMFQRLRISHPGAMKTAVWFGSLSVVCLLANACLSLYTVSLAANVPPSQSASGLLLTRTFSDMETILFVLKGFLNALIGVLGMAVIFFNGVWYLLVNWVLLKTESLPRWLCYLGLVMGGMSLLPPLGIVVLLLSIPWSLGVGRALYKTRAA